MISALFRHLSSLRSFIIAPGDSGEAARQYAETVIRDIAHVDAELAEILRDSLSDIEQEHIAHAMMAALVTFPGVRKAMTCNEQAWARQWSRWLPLRARIATVSCEHKYGNPIQTQYGIRMTAYDHAILQMMSLEHGVSPLEYIECLLADHVRQAGQPDMTRILDRLQAQVVNMADCLALVSESLNGLHPRLVAEWLEPVHIRHAADQSFIWPQRPF